MPRPLEGQETEEIAAREARIQKFGGRTPDGPDYIRIAQQQHDEAKTRVAERHELDFVFDVSVERVRRLGQMLRRSSQIEEFGYEEAVAFMRLFGQHLDDKFTLVLRDFIKEKLKK